MMRSFRKIRHCQKGFSLVEIILTIIITGILAGITSQILLDHTEAYSFIKHRQSTLSDIRYALTRVNHELLRVKTDDLVSMTANDLSFFDVDGKQTSYHEGLHLGAKALFRGNEPMVAPIKSLTIKGYDDKDQETTDIQALRKIQFSVATQPAGKEGSINITSTIMPRAFLYEGYQ